MPAAVRVGPPERKPGISRIGGAVAGPMLAQPIQVKLAGLVAVGPLHGQVITLGGNLGRGDVQRDGRQIGQPFLGIGVKAGRVVFTQPDKGKIAGGAFWPRDMDMAVRHAERYSHDNL